MNDNFWFFAIQQRWPTAGVVVAILLSVLACGSAQAIEEKSLPVLGAILKKDEQGALQFQRALQFVEQIPPEHVDEAVMEDGSTLLDLIVLASLSGSRPLMAVIRALLDKGARPDVTILFGYWGLTALRESADTAVEVIELFAAYGSDINTPNPQTELSVAQWLAAGNYIEKTQRLLKSGLDLSAESDYPPIHLAAEAGYHDYITFLLEHSVSPDQPSSSGRTALHIAASKGHLEIISLLVKSGAEVNSLTDDWRTPLSVATDKGQHAAAKLLTQLGAVVNTSKPVVRTTRADGTPIYPDDTRLHVISITRGKLAPGEDDFSGPPCQTTPARKLEQTVAEIIECHLKNANRTIKYVAEVSVKDHEQPVILALLADDEIEWTLHLAPNVQLEAVILGGRRPQSVVGLPPNVRLEVHTVEEGSCENCVKSDKYAPGLVPDAFNPGIPEMFLEMITGITPYSFQSRLQGDRFSVTGLTGALSHSDSNKSAYSRGAKLHLVGVKGGSKFGPGESDDPWWKKCGRDRPVLWVTPSTDPELLACKDRYAGKRGEREVTIDIAAQESQLVLALMAEAPTHWLVSNPTQVTIEAVILSGVGAQRVSGISKETYVEVHTEDQSWCEGCLVTDRYFFAAKNNSPDYVKVIERLRNLTGKTPSTSQFHATGEQFSISGASKNANTSGLFCPLTASHSRCGFGYFAR